MTTPLDPDSEEALRTQQGVALLGEAQGLTIVDQPSFALAGKLRKDAKDEIKWWVEFFRPLKRAADAAKTAILDREKEKLAGPLKAVEILDSMLVAFDRQQARERAIAQARAAEEATRLEAARPTPLPGEDPLLPIVVPAVAVEMPKSEDVGFANYAKAEVTDFLAFVVAVAAGKAPIAALTWQQSYLDDSARQHKDQIKPGGALLLWPGVHAVLVRRARG